MDELDREILTLLSKNGRMPVKEIAHRVSLSSPAVSERIRKMEAGGVIAGYTVRLAPERAKGYISALVSLYVAPEDRPAFLELLASEDGVEKCMQVTGQQSHIVRVCCRDIEALDDLINRLQKLGQTNTQIILWETPGRAVPML